MSPVAKSYTYEMALKFPLMPLYHQVAWRYLFDWSITGEALACAPGERLLEFGAGPCWASELLNRLGYRTFSLDINPEILMFARQRMALDQRVDPSRCRFITGDGQHLPFASASFDGVLCLNALHHMPDYELTLSEIRRVLKPGCRAVFSEPGSRHADAPESRYAVEQCGEIEKSIVLADIDRMARRVGFERMILKPYVYPQLVELDYQHFSLYRRNQAPAAYTHPAEVARNLEDGHSIFILTAPGVKPRTSASPRVLKAELTCKDKLPRVLHPGGEIAFRVQARNAGDTLWLHSPPSEFGGHVTFGTKLCLPDGQVLSDVLGRTALERDVAPGESVLLRVAFRLPDNLVSGEYVLRLDMVDELIVWFEQVGSRVLEHRFVVSG